jgi:quinol monooxygenase YgiN
MRSMETLAIAAWLGLFPAPVPAPEVPAVSESRSSDFDFLFGRWKVHNRRLRERLKGSTTWDEFEGTAVARPLWGGKANLDEYEAHGPAGHIQGLTLRVFNPRSRQWSLYWSNAANGVLDVPMIGSFKDGRGEFYDQELFEGRSIYVRFLWTASPTAPRWEQAFSADGGRTWETNWIMEFSRPREASEDCCPVMELRRYVTKPARRDDLIRLFEEHFLEGQEEHGMRILGQFTDGDRPDRFVWLRGFPDMASRRRALEGFYGGPVWAAHKAAANDTMVDVSDVLLLKPARPGSGLRLDPADRPAPSAPATAGGLVVATVYSFAAPVDARFVELFENSLAPVLIGAGAALHGLFVTEPSENTFPRLPVRQGENVFVWLASFADEAAYAAHRTRLREDPRWTTLLPALESWLAKPPEVVELQPTRRSLLRGASTRASQTRS